MGVKVIFLKHTFRHKIPMEKLSGAHSTQWKDPLSARPLQPSHTAPRQPPPTHFNHPELQFVYLLSVFPHCKQTPWGEISAFVNSAASTPGRGPGTQQALGPQLSKTRMSSTLHKAEHT